VPVRGAGAGYTSAMRGVYRAVPLVATVLAACYLIAALALTALLPVVAVAAAVATCAVALARRRQPGLGRGMLAIGCWLGFGFAGAWLLRDAPLGGLGWILAALFVAPLPIIPWVYARTFPEDDSHQRGEPR